MHHQNVNVVIKDTPSWLPGELWQRGKDVTFRGGLSDAERRIYRKRDFISPSEWCTRHRVVTTGPYAGMKFRREVFAYAPYIMDASFHKGVEEIVLCAADQAAKSFIIDSCIAYAIDNQPGPVIYTYPDEDTTKENVKDRLIPMIEHSPRLRSYMTGFSDDKSEKRIRLQHMQIYAAWATSATKMANKPARYAVADEVDKFPETAGKKEGTPLDKLRKRLRLYIFNRKMWMSSTPTIEAGPIWQELNTCDAVYEYQVKCPDCGQYQVMEFETDKKYFRWPEDEKDPDEVQGKKLGYYVCKHCGVIWTDGKRDTAVRAGRFAAMYKTPDGQKELSGGGMELFEHLNKYNPRKIGFHVPSWLSPVVSISEVCAAFMRGLKDKNKLKDFNNSHVARPWLDYTVERKEDRILALRDDRPAGIVPGGGVVSCLTAGIDTQDNGLWYEIRAWGWPDADMNMTSWQVRFGFLDGKGFAALIKILIEDRYVDAEGKEYRVMLAIQDAMGHRTKEVYDFCLLHRRFIIPAQGVDTHRMTAPISITNVEYYPGTKKPIPGGLQLLRHNATHWKNSLANKLEVSVADPGAWVLCADATEEWARHMCAEYVDEEKGIWVCPENRPNHGWDCSVLNMVAAEYGGVRYLRRPENRSQRAEARDQKSEDRERKGGIRDRFKRPKWLDRQ